MATTGMPPRTYCPGWTIPYPIGANGLAYDHGKLVVANSEKALVLDPGNEIAVTWMRKAQDKMAFRAAAEGDFVIAFYNPVSKRRRTLLAEAREVMDRFQRGDIGVLVTTTVLTFSNSGFPR